MACDGSSRAEQRRSILSEIKNYENIRDRTTIPLKDLKPLLAEVTAYLVDEVQEDNFDDNDDDDLMLAESNEITVTSCSKKRKVPSDFEDDERFGDLKNDDNAVPLALAQRILQETWGFSGFRLKQQQVIARLINGSSAVVVFPTGGGKSLVYQIPAIAFNEYDIHCGRGAGGGVTLVVSPLIALMKVSYHFSICIIKALE